MPAPSESSETTRKADENAAIRGYTGQKTDLELLIEAQYMKVCPSVKLDDPGESFTACVLPVSVGFPESDVPTIVHLVNGYSGAVWVNSPARPLQAGEVRATKKSPPKPLTVAPAPGSLSDGDLLNEAQWLPTCPTSALQVGESMRACVLKTSVTWPYSNIPTIVHTPNGYKGYVYVEAPAPRNFQSQSGQDAAAGGYSISVVAAVVAAVALVAFLSVLLGSLVERRRWVGE